MKQSPVNFHDEQSSAMPPNVIAFVKSEVGFFKQVQVQVYHHGCRTINNETNQVHHNSSQFMKQSPVNFHELAMHRIKTYQVHDN